MEVVSINGGGGAVSFLRRTSIFPSITLSHKPPPASFLPLRLSSSSSSTPTLSSCACRATKKEKEKEKEKEKNSSSLQPVVKQHDDAFKEASEEEQEEVVAEEEFDIEAFNDEMLEGDFEEFEDDFEMEDIKPYVGDGGGGGGISLCGALWDKKALTIAKEVPMSFDGDLNIFAFKASSNQLIQVRIEKLSTNGFARLRRSKGVRGSAGGCGCCGRQRVRVAVRAEAVRVRAAAGGSACGRLLRLRAWGAGQVQAACSQFPVRESEFLAAHRDPRGMDLPVWLTLKPSLLPTEHDWMRP